MESLERENLKRRLEPRRGNKRGMPWGFKAIRARAAPKGLAQSNLDVPVQVLQVLWSRRPWQEGTTERDKFNMVDWPAGMRTADEPGSSRR